MSADFPTESSDSAQESAEPTNSYLRQLLNEALRSDPEFDSFCIDYCRKVFDQFSAGMTRTAKLNLLLQHEDAAALLAKFRLFDQQQQLAKDHPGVLPAQSDDLHVSSPLGEVNARAELDAERSAAEASTASVSAPSLRRGQLRAAEQPSWRGRAWSLAGLLGFGLVAGGVLLGASRHGLPQPTAPPAPSPSLTASTHSSVVRERGGPMIKIRGGWLARRAAAKPADSLTLPGIRLPDYEIDVTEVTVAAYKECVNDSTCEPPHDRQSANLVADERTAQKLSVLCNVVDAKRDKHPVNCVDVVQAENYCTWLGRRLPTEDEWLFAALGELPGDYPWGSTPPTAEHLNACGMECVLKMTQLGIPANKLYPGNDRWPATAPVGAFSKDCSRFGVKDVAGNVAEWTSSCAVRGPGPCGTGDRVYMGGSFISNAAEPPLLTIRQTLPPESHDHTIGFRCAR